VSLSILIAILRLFLSCALEIIAIEVQQLAHSNHSSALLSHQDIFGWQWLVDLWLELGYLWPLVQLRHLALLSLLLIN
jgi:hypothetical protein